MVSILTLLLQVDFQGSLEAVEQLFSYSLIISEGRIVFDEDGPHLVR